MKTEKEQVEHYAAELKLNAFKAELNNLLPMMATENWSYLRLMAELLKKECEHRNDSRIKSKMKAANFPQLKYLQELNTEELPAEVQSVLPELETLEFINQGRSIVLYGNPGTGKTHIAIALGIKACRIGWSVFFTSVPLLLTQIREAKATKTLRSLQLRFEKYDLVICDEFGYVSCDKEGGEMLFNHLSLRTGKKATIITTNLAFNRWNEIIKDKVLVAAMVDRITHKAHLINMSGLSYRLKETQKMNEKE
jgi:DNA replication protein DnaC